jgi:hypothetical protein
MVSPRWMWLESMRQARTGRKWSAYSMSGLVSGVGVWGKGRGGEYGLV